MTEGDAAPPVPPRQALKPGQQVEVRNHFDGDWSDGFEVAEVLEGTYRVVRTSDGEALPVPIAADDVRRERRRQTWWV